MGIIQKIRYKIRLFIWKMNRPRVCHSCGAILDDHERDLGLCDPCYCEAICEWEAPHEDELLDEMIAQAQIDQDEAFNAYMEEQFYEEPEECEV